MAGILDTDVIVIRRIDQIEPVLKARAAAAIDGDPEQNRLAFRGRQGREARRGGVAERYGRV